MRNAILVFLPTLFVVSNCVADAQDRVVTLSEDKQSILVQRPGERQRSFNVIGACGIPAVGDPEIRDYKIKGSIVSVVFGKHCFADIELATGKIQCTGCD